MRVISSFDGEYRWLSNFWPCPVDYDGIRYPSAEHAYQAAKTLDQLARAEIWDAFSPAVAKRLGRAVILRPKWDAIKLDVMYEVLWSKFDLNVVLRKRLSKTEGTRLVEGNYWGDTYWGVCRGEGENWLGKLLMHVRSEIQGGKRIAPYWRTQPGQKIRARTKT